MGPRTCEAPSVAGVEPRRTIHSLLRGLEIGGILLDHRQHVAIGKPRIACRMHTAKPLGLGVELQGLIARWQRLTEDPRSGLGSQAVYGLLSDSRQATKLAEAPIIQRVGSIIACGQSESPVVGSVYEELRRRLPHLLALLLLPAAVLGERRKRLETLVRRAGEELL